MAELRIPIIVENKGKKAFGQANQSVNVLDKSVKKLGKSLAAVFGAQQLLKFAKNASMAFIEDEKAANRLALAVRNLGLEFETPRIERFISDVSRATGVTDDELRPAMQRLLQTTGSVTKAQELLAQATDIAAGSGIAYETVANDLAMAYTGQTRGLRKYSLGLTQAELKSMKFTDLQERLNKQFSGANADYLTTYAGKMQLLGTAAGEASETIGGALVDSLVSVFAAGDTTEFVGKIDTLANKIADTVSAVVFGFRKLYVLTSDRAILASFNPFDDYEKNALAAIEAAEKAAKARRNTTTMGYIGSQPVGIYETGAQASARKKAEADAAKRAKELAALQKKNLTAQKQSNALTKAAKTLDLDRIGMTAALKGKISETDRLSLQLQLALLDKNDAAAVKLSAELDSAVKRQNALSATLLATPEAPNPYRNWKVPEMGPLGGLPAGVIAGVNPSQVFPEPTPVIPPTFNVPQYAPDSLTQYGPLGGLGAGVIAGVNPTPPISITVELDGAVVGNAIRDTSINDSLSGSFNTVNRVDRFRTLAI
jgi:hypothetical protein